MWFDIVPIRSSYRGIGRSLTPQDFQSRCAKNNMDKLIEEYFGYITNTLEPAGPEVFEYMRSYCRKLQEYGVACEMIVYDLQPLESAYGRPLEFLGIDIVHEMAESLLENEAERLPKAFLNQNLLCACKEDVPKIIPLCDCGDAVWEPCWVYHLDESHIPRKTVTCEMGLAIGVGSMMDKFNRFLMRSTRAVPIYFYVFVPLILRKAGLPVALVLASAMFSFAWLWWVKWKVYQGKSNGRKRYIVDVASIDFGPGSALWR